MELNKILEGDALKILKTIPDNSIDCIVTSPPYWSLRDYEMKGQIGLESTLEEFIQKLLLIFDEIYRVLKDTGTCWVNLGDTYSSKGQKSEEINPEWHGKQYLQQKECKSKRKRPKRYNSNIPTKSLCLIPERFAIGMISRGWILRNQIIWHKPNAMPSPVKDRFTVDFEKLFFFTKSQNYYFETQYEDFQSNEHDKKRMKQGRKEYNGKWNDNKSNPIKSQRGFVAGNQEGRTKRTVWNISTACFNDSHFAVFPEKLIETPIKAGCPEEGIVLDPFFGSGTTGVVAVQNNRNWLGIELNSEYIEIAYNRIKQTQPPLNKFLK